MMSLPPEKKCSKDGRLGPLFCGFNGGGARNGDGRGIKGRDFWRSTSGD